mmetsp:Transcript_126336/g.404462  ORF Transcript_126336/g.404462 Transcript_126336/m.404462 type:complete len:222 (-) Transcript_126336:11-676(-)
MCAGWRCSGSALPGVMQNTSFNAWPVLRKPNTVNYKILLAAGAFCAAPSAPCREAVATARMTRRWRALRGRPGSQVVVTVEEFGGDEDDNETSLRPGDRVSARFHKDGLLYEGIILYQKREDVYDISWDEPDESEQITSVHIRDIALLERGTPGQEKYSSVPLKAGDKVWALFLEEKQFYDATLISVSDDEKAFVVKWDDPTGGQPTSELKRRDVKLRERN